MPLLRPVNGTTQGQELIGEPDTATLQTIMIGLDLTPPRFARLSIWLAVCLVAAVLLADVVASGGWSGAPIVLGGDSPFPCF